MKTDLLNAAGVTLALTASVLSAGSLGGSQPGQSAPNLQTVADSVVTTRQGVRGIKDASGHFVPLRQYQRIVSASSVADSLLLELCERERIVSVSREASPDSPLSYRLAGIPVLATLDDLEKVLAFSPDLVLVNNLDRIQRAQQLRAADVEVFDLGGMHGLKTLLPNIRTVATLLGRPQRGDELARRFERRMQALSAQLPAPARRGALYLGVHGDKIYGGTRGTSFHDVLQAAGLRDVAADRFEDWPRYSNEQLLMLDPEIVVTQTGMSQTLCAQSGLSALRVCRGQGRILELAPELILLPALNMLEAAEALHEAVYQ